jgi:hypothetical protein
MAKDPSIYKPWQENPNQIVELTSTTGGVISTADQLRYGTPDDNAVQSNMTDNPALSNGKNRTSIRYLRPADASVNDPQFFSGDPIQEAGLRTRAEIQAKLVRILKSSEPSGNMNKSAGEAPLREMDTEQ